MSNKDYLVKGKEYFLAEDYNMAVLPNPECIH